MRLVLPIAAASLLAACGSARPSFDIRQTASEDLLRRANHGRSILGADGRLAVPDRVRRVWIDVGAHGLETTKDELLGYPDMALIAIEPLEECWRAWLDKWFVNRQRTGGPGRAGPGTLGLGYVCMN